MSQMYVQIDPHSPQVDRVLAAITAGASPRSTHAEEAVRQCLAMMGPAQLRALERMVCAGQSTQIVPYIRSMLLTPA